MTREIAIKADELRERGSLRLAYFAREYPSGYLAGPFS
jgi:hypothetical protein